ncbi:MAG: type I glyceraldehyde-3-phosphate dehydrogenase [Sandaracinaceae bacterium]|nr:type I glyceraldehyde-3-phosphate dehydrogenase [Sandaracinaceae bacterium]
MGTKIAINGFGRIGRCVARMLHQQGSDDIELVAINDLTTNETLAHLLKFDSVHRTFAADVAHDDESITIDGRKIPCFAIPDPAELPWKDLGVDVVLECTGRFVDKAGAGKHLTAGAERVIISAPGKAGIDGTFCVGINTDGYDPATHRVVSNASCTTNCLAPVAKVVHETFGIVKGQMVTVHSYTNDQRILDLPHKDLRRARAAAMSMIPTTTGAAKAIGLVIPDLMGKLDGSAIRVPTPDVSLVVLTAQLAKKTTAEAVNAALKAASEGPLKGVLGYEERPLVSNDFIGSTYSSVVDAALTGVMGDDLLQVQSWYDNEWGFSARMLDLTRVVASKG